jgi:hypothetical protein
MFDNLNLPTLSLDPALFPQFDLVASLLLLIVL